ncbi:MAG: DNA cytosine methyltransferase, partial [Bifidobacterium crudilactis]|nr:DNA cytosine methyltransferase [Bifidobacterium crudilactis]
MSMRYISLFSGIEAASCAWEHLGWEPIAFSEIEPLPKAVLKHHYPNVPDLGDITKIDWSSYVGSADVVVGGSPCQSFSVAGSRTGLAGASGLMWEYVRAVQAIRPQWFVWENVPGALSSSHGEDFRCLLESMDGLGYGLAWRVLDAQFFGVAQRRRRVFLVGHLGDRRAAEVLFERESVQWNSASSREKRQALTKGTQNGARTAGRSIDWNRTDGRCRWPDDPTLVQTLSAHMGTGGDNVPPVYQIAGNIIGRANMSATLTCGVQQTLFPGNGTVRRLTPVECERLQG